MTYTCACACQNCITRIQNISDNLALYKTKLAFQSSIIALYRKVFQQHLVKRFKRQSYADFTLERRGIVDTFDQT